MSGSIELYVVSRPFSCFSQPSPVVVKCSNLSVKGSPWRRPLHVHDLGIHGCFTLLPRLSPVFHVHDVIIPGSSNLLTLLSPSPNPLFWVLLLNPATRVHWACTSRLIFPAEYHRMILHPALTLVYKVHKRGLLNKWKKKKRISLQIFAT